MDIIKSSARKLNKKTIVCMSLSLVFALLLIVIETQFFNGITISLSELFGCTQNFIENTLAVLSVLLAAIFTIGYISEMGKPEEADTENNQDIIREVVEVDFEDKELNRLVKKIKNKVDFLKEKPLIKRDIESSLMIEQIQNEYIQNIHESYIGIPPDKRGNINVSNSSYDLTVRQMNLILDGLDKIEERLVENNMVKQKATEIFLKEKIIGL